MDTWLSCHLGDLVALSGAEHRPLADLSCGGDGASIFYRRAEPVVCIILSPGKKAIHRISWVLPQFPTETCWRGLFQPEEPGPETLRRTA